jgi:hypothetical protein
MKYRAIYFLDFSPKIIYYYIILSYRQPSPPKAETEETAKEKPNTQETMEENQL